LDILDGWLSIWFHFAGLRRRWGWLDDVRCWFANWINIGVVIALFCATLPVRARQHARANLTAAACLFCLRAYLYALFLPLLHYHACRTCRLRCAPAPLLPRLRLLPLRCPRTLLLAFAWLSLRLAATERNARRLQIWLVARRRGKQATCA